MKRSNFLPNPFRSREVDFLKSRQREETRKGDGGGDGGLRRKSGAGSRSGDRREKFTGSETRYVHPGSGDNPAKLEHGATGSRPGRDLIDSTRDSKSDETTRRGVPEEH